jgi:ankyrin repeat protein
LFIALCKGECDVVNCLLSSGADINLCDIKGQSPLFIASCKGECDVVKCLLSSGADIIPELSKHLTTSHSPLHDDINNGDCPFMSHKLISAPELSKLLKTSHSPLHDAINNGDCPCLSHYLDVTVTALDMLELIFKYVNPKCINMNLMPCFTSSFFKLLRKNTPLTVASETGNLCIVNKQ